MDGGEEHCLFDAIDAFLCGKRVETRVHECRSFWQERNSISRDEIGVLIDLSREARCAEAIASRLARDVASTQEMLDAFEAIGLIERCGTQYKASQTTALYCWSLLENPSAE